MSAGRPAVAVLARRLRRAHPLWPRWKCDLEAKRRTVERNEHNRHLVSGEPSGAPGNVGARGDAKGPGNFFRGEA